MAPDPDYRAYPRTRTLGRNRRWQGGMLFGGTDSNDIVVWIDEDTYQSLGKPTKVTVEVKSHVKSHVG